MSSRFYLPPPSKKYEVGKALTWHHDMSALEHRHKSIHWTYTHWYLQGMRTMRIRGLPAASAPALTFIDHQGKRRVRWEKAYVQHEIHMGRILGLDLRPAVRRRPGLSLGGIREDGIAQAVLDHISRKRFTRQTAVSVAYHLSAFGMCGILVDRPENPGEWEPNLRLIPPWELRPMPTGMTDISQLGGVTWVQWVPLEWLRERLKGVAKIPKPADSNDIKAITAPYGAKLHVQDAPTTLWGDISGVGAFGGATTSSYWGPNADNTQSGGKADTQYVEFKQHWILGDDYTAERYIVQVGRGEPIIDADYTSPEWQEKLGGELPVCPLAILRASEVGSFWPRGFADRQIPLNREVESLLGDFTENLRQMDRLRFLAIPLSSGINKRNFHEHLRNRILPYQPDYVAMQHKPELIAPPNTGDAFGRAINMLVTMMDGTAAQGELLTGKVPGRTDSADALSIVAEQQGTPLAALGELIEYGMTHVWKACLSYARKVQQHLGREIAIDVHRMDEMFVGVTIDVAEGKLSFKEGEWVPDPRRVDITIRSKAPRDKQAIHAELQESVAQGRMSIVDYQIACIKEALDLPIVDKTAYMNYEAAWLENIVIFGDGETPGNIDRDLKPNPMVENHVIHLMVHLELAQSALFKAASDAVQTAIIKMITYHRTGSAWLPDQLQVMDKMGQRAPQNADAAQAMGARLPSGMSSAVNQL